MSPVIRFTPTGSPGLSAAAARVGALRAGRSRGRSGGRVGHRDESGIPEGARDDIAQRAREPAERERRGDGPHQDAELRAARLVRRAEAFEPHVGGAVGERLAEPRERLPQRGRDLLRREREVEPGTPSAGRSSGRRAGRLDHLLDRRDAGDRLLRKRPERVRDGAEQTPVDVDGASAHACDDARGRQRAAFEARDDQVATRGGGVAKDAEDADRELLDAVTLEDRAAHADHAGTDLVHRHVPGAAAGQAAMASAMATIAARVHRFMGGLETAFIIARHAGAPGGPVRKRTDTITASPWTPRFSAPP